MSRGLGTRQRLIMESFDDHAEGSGLVVTSDSASRADEIAMRRAAYSLARRDLVRLEFSRVDDVRRLVVYRERLH